MTSYPAGVPSWLDIGTPDVPGAAAFYRELFGWETAADARPEAGGYTQFLLRGHRIAGLGPATDPGPPAWTTYVTVDDAAAAADRGAAAAGEVRMEPVRVFDQGTLAVLADPGGAVFAVWQAGRHVGSELAGEPGTPVWHELHTRDLDRAADFYATMFGWTARASSFVPGATVFVRGEEGTDGADGADGTAPVAGLTEAAPYWPPGSPDRWLPYIAVEDADAAAARAGDLGGRVIAAPADHPAGRVAVLADPQAAPFAIITTRPDPG